MTEAEVKRQILRGIAAMTADQPASWGEPKFWREIADAVASLIVDLRSAISPVQLATLMWIGAAAQRQEAAEASNDGEASHG